jgi:uncharacterized membrane protein
MSTEITRGSKERSVKNLVTDVRRNAALLAKQEIALKKAELKETATHIAKKAALFGAAGVLAYAGVLVLCAAIVLGLIALGIAAWLAALTVGAAILAGAFLIVRRARQTTRKSADT